MAALDNIASELLKAANVADLNFKKTRDQAERDKAVRLRRIVENLKAISAGGLTPTLDQVLTEGNTSTNTLNVGGITTDYVQLDTTATPTLAPGMFGWNDAYGTADLRLKGNNVTLQLGQETLARVVNKTGSDLLESEYKVVRVRIASEGGAQGQRLAVVLAQGLNDPDSATTLGIVTETIPNNQEGFITVFGNVNNINTTGSLQGETWADGDVLYLSPTIAGGLTKVKPVAPQHMVVMGYVVYAHAINGKIFVKVDNGYELDELHNVLITSPANNDLLQYNSAQQVWKNVASSVAVPTPTLAQVTTAGNTTTNAITVGNITVNSSTNELKIFDVTGGNYTRIKDRTIAFSRNNGTSESVSIYSPDNQLWLRARSGIYIYSGVNSGETYFFAKDSSGTNRIQVKDTGAVILQESNNNVLIGTTTDAGYKLDVNGTIRSTSSIWTDFLSPVGSTMYIYSVGLSGGAYNRLNIYYNSVNGFVMQSDGGGGGSRNMSIFGGGPGGVLNLGTNGAARWTLLSSYDASGPGHLIPNGTNTYDIGNSSNTVRNLYSNRAIFSGSVTASASLANAVSIANTLVAAANNDVLVGLDINPTFTNGAFTGVTNWGIRSAADFTFTARNSTITVLSPAASSNGNSLTIKAGNATTSGTGGNLLLLSGSGVGGPGSGQVIIGNDTSTYNNVVLRGYTYVQSTGPNQGTAFAVLAGGQTALSIYWDNLTPFMQYGLVTSRQSRFVNSSSYSFDNNVIIGGNTNAGYKLDVNGTGRFSGQVKFDNSNIIATGITSQVANFQIARANTNTSVEIIGGATSVKFDATSASASTQFAGKVAIGSAYFTPTEMLHVDGSIKSSALTINGPVLATGGVLSSIAGYTGLFTVPTNPPGMQTLDIQNGIIVNVL